MFKQLVILAGVCSLTACSGQSIAAPGGLAANSGLDANPASRGVPGVYDLTFWGRLSGVWQEVSSMPLLNEVILKAQVTDVSGTPATAGTVTFEYCSYGGRKNDITNADEAPKEACELGQARWTRLGTWTVGEGGGNCLAIGGGSACLNFGLVRIPRTIGFRFRYAQKGSIASGTSPARNFVWTAQLP